MNWKHSDLINLRPFQHKFLKGMLKPGILTSCLSTPRGQGKSTLMAWMALQTLVPGSPLFQAKAENHLVAASLGQCRRTTFGVLRRMVESLPNAGEYLIADNSLTARIRHPKTRTELSVLPASGKSAMGIVNSKWIFCDEPASWKVGDGKLMFDALTTALGKPQSGLRLLFVGTQAPAGEGHWWTDLLSAGSSRSVHVTLFQGSSDPDEWHKWPNIKRCNPLMIHFPESRSVLLEERDKARLDPRLRSRFMSYRLNVATKDETGVVITVEDWKRTLARDVPARAGQPVVGIDAGGSRAWSAATAVWPSGRCEAVALCPGIPSVRDQEKRDMAQPGSYARLVDQGSLIVAQGQRIPSLETLVDYVRGWDPRIIVCDRFRLAELFDTDPPCHVTPRIQRWSSATEDITSLRRAAADGPLSITVGSRSLLQASLSVAQVATDDGGNCRLRKSTANASRDDVVQSLILAVGEWKRRLKLDAAPSFYAFASGDGSEEVLVM